MRKQALISRIDVIQYENAFGFEKFLVKSRLSSSLKGLIKVRVSQINDCSFCLNLHTVDLIVLGETEKRINSIKEWRKVSFFNETEQAVLALAEELTFTDHKCSDNTINNISRLLDEVSLAQAIIVILATNAWNKIATAIPEVSGLGYSQQTSLLKSANAILYLS